MVYRLPTYFGFPYTSWFSSSNTYWDSDKIKSWQCTWGFVKTSARDVREDDFSLVFGFPAIKSGRFEQGSVDAQLKHSAELYARACKHAQELQAIDMVTYVVKLQSQVKCALKSVAKTYATFWTAHRIAKENGYEVRKSHTNYLS